MPAPSSTLDLIEPVWRDAGLAPAALGRLDLTGADPVLPSSFAVGAAAQASLSLAALAATEIGVRRGDEAQTVAIDMADAAIECSAAFTLDGEAPLVWDKIAGLYPCGPGGSGGWVRLHTNFAHHRDGVLRLLGLPPGPDATREQVRAALEGWEAERFEAAASEAGLVVAAVRDFVAWDRHPQQAAVARGPLVEIARIGDGPPLAWPSRRSGQRPLEGLRVLELTRILAGPVAGRTLAAYGADVMLVNAPHLPNIEAIADTSRGKRSALADLRRADDRAAFDAVLADAHVMLQGYRPGGLAALGYGPDQVAQQRPGIVYVSLSAYGSEGPWASKRGFDSLVQTATGFNRAEADAAGSAEPKALPVQILDMASGFLMAFGAEAALLHQQREGGSCHVQVSLARTAQWLRSMGQVEHGFAVGKPDLASRMEASDTGFGRLLAVRHAARFSATPARYDRASSRPGAHPLAWD